MRGGEVLYLTGELLSINAYQPTQPKKRPSHNQYKNPANLLPPPFGSSPRPRRVHVSYRAWGPTSHPTTVSRLPNGWVVTDMAIGAVAGQVLEFLCKSLRKYGKGQTRRRSTLWRRCILVRRVGGRILRRSTFGEWKISATYLLFAT